ncbi:MAG: hypothetical protein IIB17_02610 [Chloroflexi bacterium]|nr:hypothetical protein [Chloroflexota bacterium]
MLADQQTGSAQIYAVAAHELGHLVAKGRFGSKLADGVISEGVATWAAEDPWLAWLGFNSFDSAVRTIVSDGAYIPFSEAFESEISGLSVDECWESRNIQYTEWASFVGYLIEEYGMDTLARLWDTGKEPRQTSVRIRGTGSGPPAIAPLLSSTPSSEDMIPPKLDYQGVYGKSLEELELEWLNVLGLSAGN